MIKCFKKLFAFSLGLCICLNILSFDVAATDDTLSSDFSSARLDEEYNQSRFDFSDGLPSNTVNAVAQTSDGSIWIGTDSGLVRYNAKYFEKYDFESFDNSDLCITALACDGSGCLWVGTAENGLFRLNDNKIELFDTLGYLSERICALECDASGNIVAAAKNGIAVIDAQSLEISNLCDELTSADKSLVDISAASNGLIWCVTENSSVYFIANGSKASVDIDGSEGSAVISAEKPISVYACDSGRVYVGTASSEVIYFDPCDDGSFDSGIIRCEDVNAVFSFVQDSQSRVWMCTDNGIGYIENNKAYMASSRFSGKVSDAFSDSESSIWFCSQSEGALQLSHRRLVNISAQAGMENELCNCVAVYNNLLYIGTDEGLAVYDALNNSSIVENELTALLDGVKINCLVTEENGNLLIGIDEKYGFIRYNAGTDRSWSIFNSENGLSGDSVSALTVISSDSVAAATENGVNIIQNNGVIAAHNTDFNLISLEADLSGKLYAASDNGVYILENGNFVLLHEELSECYVYDICLVSESQLVISTDNGLYVCSDSSITDVSDALNDCNSVIDIVCDENKRLYLVCSDSVYSASVDELMSGKEAKNLCGTDSLEASATFGAKSCIMNDVLYICTIDGVVAVKIAAVENTPSLSINSVYCDGEKCEIKDGVLELDSRTKVIEIDASVLSYTGENQITYVLEGFDESSKIISSNELIRYTNLDGGKYTLKIYGTSSDGQKTNVLTIDISKKNIWYESPIFWVVLVLAAAIISFLISMFFIVEKLRKEESLQSVRANLSAESIMAVSKTIDVRSNVLTGHSKRVAAYSLEIAKRLKCDDDFKEGLYLAALLHDIGNIGVSDEILKKPHKLTPEEIKSMQQHVEIGHSVLREYDGLRELADAVLYHHERYDGIGYLKKLSGEEIPLSARIIFASESLDAMLTEKPYRPKLTRERIINEFTVGSGTQFDPEIASVVIKMVEAGFSTE